MHRAQLHTPTRLRHPLLQKKISIQYIFYKPLNMSHEFTQPPCIITLNFSPNKPERAWKSKNHTRPISALSRAHSLPRTNFPRKKRSSPEARRANYTHEYTRAAAAVSRPIAKWRADKIYAEQRAGTRKTRLDTIVSQNPISPRHDSRFAFLWSCRARRAPIFLFPATEY